MKGATIRKQTFRKKFQGVDPDEVAKVLDEVAAEVDRLTAENAELTRRAAESEAQLKDYRQVEKALQQTLLQGQESAAKSVDQARREAQMIIQDAEAKGAAIVEKSRAELASLREQVTIISAKRESLVNRLRTLLTSELETLDSLGAPDTAPAGDAAPGEAVETRAAATDDIDDIVSSLDRP